MKKICRRAGRLHVVLALFLSLSCTQDSPTALPEAEETNPPTNDQGGNPDTGMGGNTGHGDPGSGEAALLPCEEGMAGTYPCSGYDLIARLSLEELDATSANDIWGWADASSGREFALIGLDNGTAFVEVTEPLLPVLLGKLPTATSSSAWRDIKVYGHYALIVSEAPSHGMQVFDLHRLLEIGEPPVVFDQDAHYAGFGNAHNVVVNPEEAMAYVVGTSRSDLYGGGVHFVDLSDPLRPEGVGGFGEAGYTHDAQVVNYRGPDTNYTGRSILFGCNEDFVAIADVTDKENPRLISILTYAQKGYTHQGWLTEDHAYLLLGDELDEVQTGRPSRTLVVDLGDLDLPQVLAEYEGPTRAIDHNGYVLGSRFFLANYTAGFREIDISGISSGQLIEAAYFDTYPQDNSTAFQGAWSVYPYLPGGVVLISDIDNGFFAIRRTAQ